MHPIKVNSKSKPKNIRSKSSNHSTLKMEKKTRSKKSNKKK
jgi:hypothetical protein